MNIGLFLITSGFIVFLSIFLAVFIKIFTKRGSMSGLLAEASHEQTRMLRLQYLLFSLFGTFTYLILVVSGGKFPSIPDISIVLLGVSSTGYLGGKGWNAYHKMNRRKKS